MKTNRQQILLWQSSYDRGLNILLMMWPKIRAVYPEAQLHCAYGWDLFDKVTGNNAERQQWKAKVQQLMQQESVFEHGRLGKEELKKLQQECGILAYCSDFYEIFCISALEAQAQGCVPVTTDVGALKEFTVGRVIVPGDIYNPNVKTEYRQQLLALMGDKQRFETLQSKGVKFAKDYSWEKTAKDWVKVFAKPQQDIKVSICLPTNRRGWWNIMAQNLASQTYKNIEWVIVDDYPTNRQELAKEYSLKYELPIVYLRGKKRKIKRNYGLVNADNTALEHVKGELFVCLQDFILLEPTGIEDLVNLYRKNPDCLIAPVDEYFAPKIKPDTQSEDWFNGVLDVKGEFMRSNVRIANKGLRFSDHAFDFEQNYGAIPTKILKELGGWFEFFDFGLGFNNTEIAWRAIQAGYRILIDETNIATCIDHWNTLEGTAEHGLLRERRLNDPLFLWMMQMIKDGKLPLKRTQELDDTINLTYEMPQELDQKDAVVWMREHLDEIVLKWIKEKK